MWVRGFFLLGFPLMSEEWTLDRKGETCSSVPTSSTLAITCIREAMHKQDKTYGFGPLLTECGQPAIARNGNKAPSLGIGETSWDRYARKFWDACCPPLLIRAKQPWCLEMLHDFDAMFSDQKHEVFSRSLTMSLLAGQESEKWKNLRKDFKHAVETAGHKLRISNS